MKLQAKQGGSMRDFYTFFEIEALKKAFNEDMPAGETFPFGNNGTIFTVVENTAESIAIKRGDTGKTIEANKVERATRKPQAPTQQKPQENEGQSVEEAAAAFARLLMNAKSEQKTETPSEPVDYEKIARMIDERINKAQTFTVKINDRPAVEVSGIAHEKFNEALFWAANNQPVYLYGPAGTGKNVLAKQVAEALQLPFYYAGSLQFKSDLEGFVDAGGNYVETDFYFYKAFTGGGVFLLDEIDGTAAEVLVAFGAALANRYYNFPKYGRVEANENFIVMAAGNTAGRGATEAYNGRYQLDASTLDRFVFIELNYDKQIELAAANNDSELVAFAHVFTRAACTVGMQIFTTLAVLRFVRVIDHLAMSQKNYVLFATNTKRS